MSKKIIIFVDNLIIDNRMNIDSRINEGVKDFV